MKDELKAKIPKRSFGFCRWCGAENARLTYLMCPNCGRINNMVPSKTMVCLNNPEVKKRIQAMGGTTVANIVPEVRNFILNPKSRFPPEASDQEHWKTVVEETAYYVSEDEIQERKQYYSEVDQPDKSSEELEAEIAIDRILQFMIIVNIVTGNLKVNIDPASFESFIEVCDQCLANVVKDASGPARPDSGPAKPEAEKPAGRRTGMNVSDILKRRR